MPESKEEDFGRLVHSGVYWGGSGFFVCLTSRDCRRTSLSASTSQFSVGREQTFPINPALVSGIKQIISFIVRQYF